MAADDLIPVMLQIVDATRGRPGRAASGAGGRPDRAQHLAPARDAQPAGLVRPVKALQACDLRF